MPLDDTKVLSTPAIYVDGVLTAITPNSASMTLPGEMAVRVQSSGGTSVKIVAATDAESLKGMCKFSLANTARNVDLVRDWKAKHLRGIPSTVTIATETAQFPFDTMFIVNAPEAPFETEGDLEVELEGRFVE